MRYPVLRLIAAAALALAAGPASAQLSGGVGSSNAANQSFQMQNQMRGMQQQQTFQNNQNRLQSDSNRMYDCAPAGSAPIRRRR